MKNSKIVILYIFFILLFNNLFAQIDSVVQIDETRIDSKYQDYKYDDLEGIVVTGKKIALWEILKKVKEQVSMNYINGDIPLKYIHKCLVANNKDTNSYFYVPMVLFNSKATTMSYFQYFDSNLITKNIDSSCFDNYNYIRRYSFLYPNKFKNIIDVKYYKRIDEVAYTYILASEIEDNPVIDIILVQKEAAPIDFGFLLNNRNFSNFNNLKNLVLLTAIKYKINLSNYAIEEFTRFDIPVNDSIFAKKLKNISSTNEFLNFLSTLRTLEYRSFELSYSFRQCSKLGNRYVLDKCTMKDNLFLPNYKFQKDPEYSFIQSWDFEDTLDSKVWNLEDKIRIVDVEQSYIR